MTAAAFPTVAPPAPKIRRYSVAEYVQREIETDEKHYFINGILIPMAGGTLTHNSIQSNTHGELYIAIRSKPEFRIFGSDQKIYLPALNIYNYADVLVIAGTPLISDEESNAIENPIMIVEVLSKSTGGYDRGQKFTEYQTLPSFREYVLIHQDKPQINSYFLEPDGRWRPAVFTGLESEAWFETVGCRVPLSSIYRNVSFETETAG